ncbi:hypothetical protein J2S13_001243 [Oikeobacillus pervagus]|uniref:Aspartyl-phosphate phosphatase Spo0E family protein n=1 Tax=Oikeobacillus pervagus TaxID=1325931 RepID=A0AAJ1WK80_9BACI|nr:aspartyl-phosphate phosphatase Spo0E family protein [Oikeobacillus pervagus]MDQ0214846.1 hypothetical protein [Oikeobacillus pervagus]
MKYSIDEKQELLEKIQTKREEMTYYGQRLGLGASETIRCSQELDQLLNKYQAMQQSFFRFVKRNGESRVMSFVIMERKVLTESGK